MQSKSYYSRETEMNRAHKLRKKYQCSYCGLSGHNKSRCPDLSITPKHPPGTTHQELSTMWLKEEEEKELVKAQFLKSFFFTMCNKGAFTSNSIPLYMIAAILYRRQ
jgi:hypothetical protein